MKYGDSRFKSSSTLISGNRTYEIFRLESLAGKYPVEKLPFCLKILLENLLRHEDDRGTLTAAIDAVAGWTKTRSSGTEVFCMPARVLMQDFTGVPCLVDLAAMRDAVKELGGNPRKINPLIPVSMIIDHSVQADSSGKDSSYSINVTNEYRRNSERYFFLKSGQKSFSNFSLIPPGTGIVHQVNLEFLSRVVWTAEKEGRLQAYPDTVIGTDSHTTMTNGMGVMSWGVGGIEAEAVMLGQPITMLVPEVVGFKLYGTLAKGSTATDAVLLITQMLRKKGVVGKFVEFYGPGIDSLSVADRATIANMAPEYGATIGFFPVDYKTLDYMANTGRSEDLLRLIEDYCMSQGLFRKSTSAEPVFTDILELDLSTVQPAIAGPRRPQDRIILSDAKAAWKENLQTFLGKDKTADVSITVPVGADKKDFTIGHGSVVLAAITSCTNTSNPYVMIGAGLLARKAVEKGLTVKPWVKTTLSPGSRVVMDYYRDSGLLEYLEKLGFYLAGFGCMTCIGNSGPIENYLAQAITENKLVVAAVLSGNRNFEGRINPYVKASFLASPPLVIAYAIAGTVNIDFDKEPLGTGKNGLPVYLRDIWPADEEISEIVEKHVKPEFFISQYNNAAQGDENWQAIPASENELFAWQPDSTYIRKPPYFDRFKLGPGKLSNIYGARALVMLGDSVTTDHISPAGNIAKDSPAAKYLLEHGVQPEDFNTYGARRGNHEVMMRGTFANIRLRNLMLDGIEGGQTLHLPAGTVLSVFDAAMLYKKEDVPLIVIAGREYGSGSSRDWAAKGPALLGVRAILAVSFERIHRSNLVGMGILPLQFVEGQNAALLGLTGKELFDIEGIDNINPGNQVKIKAKKQDGKEIVFTAIVRLNTPAEVEYYTYGGILPFVLNRLMPEKNISIVP